jgi:uncharacterized protein DUF1648
MLYRPLVFLFVMLLIAVSGVVAGTSGALPERVASHFSAAGLANGYMSRDAYRIFMLAFGFGVPLVVVALIAWLPRLAPNLINIPNRDYWLAPERREATLAALDACALWLGCLLTAMAGGVHWLIIRANAGTPPKLENSLLFTLLGAFVSGLVCWIIVLMWRFRKIS